MSVKRVPEEDNCYLPFLSLLCTAFAPANLSVMGFAGIAGCGVDNGWTFITMRKGLYRVDD